MCCQIAHPNLCQLTKPGLSIGSPFPHVKNQIAIWRDHLLAIGKIWVCQSRGPYLPIDKHGSANWDVRILHLGSRTSDRPWNLQRLIYVCSVYLCAPLASATSQRFSFLVQGVRLELFMIWFWAAFVRAMRLRRCADLCWKVCVSLGNLPDRVSLQQYASKGCIFALSDQYVSAFILCLHCWEDGILNKASEL